MTKTKKMTVIKKTVMIDIRDYLTVEEGDESFDGAYLNPTFISKMLLDKGNNKLILLEAGDKKNAWVFPNNQKTKKMLALFFDYINPADYLDDDKQQEENHD